MPGRKPNPRFLDERDRLMARLDHTIRFALSEAGIPPVNDLLEEVYGRYSIGPTQDKREVRFFLGDVAAFSPELLNRLRRSLGEAFPGWSVVPQFEECHLTVTRGWVDFGCDRTADPITEMTEPYQAWMRSARDHDEKKFGPLRRQLRWITPRVGEYLERMAAERIVPLGSFDRYRLPFTGRPLWVLLQPQDKYTYTASGGAAAHYPVDSLGRLHPHHDERFNALDGETPAAWLAAFVLEPQCPSPVPFFDANRQPIVRVQSPELILDSQLCTARAP